MYLKVGEIIKWKEAPNKRVMLKVEQSHGVTSTGGREWSITLAPVYKPSPKSMLRRKTKFSKHKYKLV